MVRDLRLQFNSKSNMNTTTTAENIAIFSSTGTGGNRCTFLRWISLTDLRIYTYRRHRCTFLHRNSMQLLDFCNLTGRCCRFYNRLNIMYRNKLTDIFNILIIIYSIMVCFYEVYFMKLYIVTVYEVYFNK